MPLNFVPSHRGKLLNVDNYLYRRDRGDDNKCSWRCVLKTCKARIHTTGDEAGVASLHTHAPDVAGVEVRILVASLKSSAVKSKSISNSTLVAQAVSAIGSEAIRGRMPNLSLLRQQVANARKRAGPSLPPEPKKRENLVIPDFVKISLKNEPFLHYDSGEGDLNRMLIFATPANLTLLRQNHEWYVDGTFKTCPLIFHQLYTIHVKLADGITVPAVYALLPSKSRQTYARFLNIIEEAVEDQQPEAIHVDFELAMIRELESHFPHARVLGCAFHFNQSLWRQIQSDSELLNWFSNDADMDLITRMFSALSFVPVADVVTAFNALVSSPSVRRNDAILASFIRYFQRTWVGGNGRPPRFKAEWWNLHSLVLAAEGQTNNEVEGWHSAFSSRVGACHPTVVKLIQHLQVEQGKAEFIVSNAPVQGSGVAKRKKYRDRQTRLHTLLSSYAERGMLQFLEAVAQNIRF